MTYKWLDNETYEWKDKPQNDMELEKRIKGLFWKKGGKQRVLLLNMNVPIVRKNVDLCLLAGTTSDVRVKGNTTNSLHRMTEKYVGLGELKGGIDPAGADEHWKTANSALNRIRASFIEKGLQPSTFFVGAAIEKNMANEIYKQLCDKTLSNASNLTVDKQLTSICDWLISL